MRLSYCQFNRKLVQTVMFLIVSGIASTIDQDARSDGSEVSTHISCSDPRAPILILQVKFPNDAGVFEHALSNDVCRYTDDDEAVTPLYFFQKVRAEPAAAEPFGYIWAIRLGDRKVSFWYFWKDEHEKMLMKMRNN